MNRLHHTGAPAKEILQISNFIVRRYKIESFPYKIFYTLSKDTIFILGISHAKRGNAFVRKRLKLL